MRPSRYTAEVAGQRAAAALAAGEGEVCAVFRRSFYLRLPGERYACVGDASLGRGPLNALVSGFELPAIGEKISVSTQGSQLWEAPARGKSAAPDLESLRRAASGRTPREGLGCLVAGTHNALSIYAQPALEALERWLVGNALGAEVEALVGLGPGLTPSGDDYLGGMLVALRCVKRDAQAKTLWRWLEPRLAARTSAISAAHLAAAAAGEAHEALHVCLEKLFTGKNDWPDALAIVDRVGHCSGWDGLAGAVMVARNA
jgi:uncharacterized protein DUF2877